MRDGWSTTSADLKSNLVNFSKIFFFWQPYRFGELGWIKNSATQLCLKYLEMIYFDFPVFVCVCFLFSFDSFLNGLLP